MFNETHLYRAEEALTKAKTVLLCLSLALALVELGYGAAVSNGHNFQDAENCGQPDCEICSP